MFSEELYMLDRNTEKYMFDEMQNELDEMRGKLNEMRNDLNETQDDLTEARNNLAETQNDLAEARNILDEMNDKYRQSIKNTVIYIAWNGLVKSGDYR